jgi:hypothetical protein
MDTNKERTKVERIELRRQVRFASISSLLTLTTTVVVERRTVNRLVCRASPINCSL